MATISIPKNVASNVDRNFMKFWWGFPPEKNHNLILKSWKSICRPKSMGGMRIRLVSNFNRAFLCKIGWHLTLGSTNIWSKCLVTSI